MTHEEFKQRFPHASESTLKRNAHLAGGLQAQGSKPTDGRKGNDPELDVGPTRVEVRCELTSYRKRLLDEHENHAYSFKRLVDKIAEDLGVPDNDPRLIWRFYQVQIRDGRECCAVRIEVIYG